jgi:hypothetical protein
MLRRPTVLLLDEATSALGKQHQRLHTRRVRARAHMLLFRGSPEHSSLRDSFDGTIEIASWCGVACMTDSKNEKIVQSALDSMLWKTGIGVKNAVRTRATPPRTLPPF